ncbi:hypothetical protein [Allomuricauda sp. d1]|uniref:hypothetical protein n=1 Tax=Allomuricauda sp. d1 TaxID=3136725 RepID=UPI0031D92660
MKKILPFLDIFSLTGLLIYNLALFLGMLRFGREMGDLGYYAILVLGTIIVLILFFLKYKGVFKKGTVIVSLLALGLLFFIIYYSSFGRGPDFPWNGQFFG